MTNLMNIVLAELTAGQKKRVRGWIKPQTYPAAKKISDHVFGNKTRITKPFNGESTASHVKEWVHHNTPYHVDSESYKHGFAHKKEDQTKRRPVKIGKVLEQHKAPENVKKAYVNDHSRTEIDPSEHRVTISRHPYDVAGMSTDKQWKSCMGMDKKSNNGSNLSKYLRHDIVHGTHVAYLHHKDDTKIDKPLARIALKPFVSSNGHTILHPEEKTYGIDNKHFRKQVEDWTKKNFPPHENTVYKKHPKVYDDSAHLDDGNNVILNHTNNKHLFKNNSLDSLEDAASRDALRNHTIKYEDIQPHIDKLSNKHYSLNNHIAANLRHQDFVEAALHHNKHLNANLRDYAESFDDHRISDNLNKIKDY